MSVYMIIEIEVLDESTYAEYVRKVPATVAKYGGRYLVRGGPITSLAGDWRPERIIVLEFASAAQMELWNTSPEYLELAPIRTRAARTRAIAVEGITDEGHANAAGNKGASSQLAKRPLRRRRTCARSKREGGFWFLWVARTES